MSLVLPFLGLVAFASLRIASDFAVWQGSSQTAAQTALAAKTSLVIHNLQVERGTFGGVSRFEGDEILFGTGGSAPQNRRGASRHDRVGQGLSGLRATVDSLAVSNAEVFGFYTAEIRTDLEQIASVATEARQPEISGGPSPIFRSSTSKEFMGQQRAAVNGILSAGAFTDESARQLDTVLAALDQNQKSFDRFALPEDLAWERPLVSGPKASAADALLSAVLSSPKAGPFPVTAEWWFAAISAKIEIMKTIDDGCRAG